MSVLDFVRPRVSCFPEVSSSAGQEAVELAALAGLHLDPWEAFVLEHSLGEGADGRWAAAEVGICVPRQNGKNAILEARELAGLYLLGEDLLIHSAQQFKTAKEHFLRILGLIEATPELVRRVRKVTRTHGEEGIELMDGQRLLFFARSKSSGRGFAQADFVAFDESMFLPEFVIGNLVPTQSSNPNPQRWYVGSAVDQVIHPDGVVFARVRDRGHKGDDDRLAWFEWGADADTPANVDEDMFQSPDVWAQANPGLGIRISTQAVQDELRALDRRTFAVERLGVGDWPDVDADGAAIISDEDWQALESSDGEIVGPVCFAFDVSPERTTSIAVCGRDADGNRQVEVIRHDPGTDWLAAKLDSLERSHSPDMICCDGFGPAASLVGSLADLGVKVVTLTSTDHGQACGQFIDAVQGRTLRHLGSLELRNAVKGAAVRPLGDAWAFSRKNSGVDISPLVAVTFAHWASKATDTGGDWTFYK